MNLTENVYLVGSGEYGLSHSFDCSVYLIVSNNQGVLIDTGAGIETERIFQNIIHDGIDPHIIKAILLTHEHADHVGGAAWLRDRIGCKVYSPEGADKLIEKGTEEELGLSIAKRSGVYSPSFRYPHFKVDGVISDGDTIRIGDLQLRSISVPGHSKYSMCYFLKKKHYTALFSGDVVFFGGEIGLLNCPGSSLSDYRANIHKLANLSVEGLFPGHKVFTLKKGQQHIDMAIRALSRLAVPPTFFREIC